MINELLLKNNYLVISNFINSERAKKLSEDFYNYSCKNMPGDGQVPNSNSQYNYISFLELLCEKTPQISSIVEEPVLPTYSYARIYKNKSALEKHVDREACEISLTIHLNGDKEWPIWIKTPKNEEKCVILYPGDAMLYLGQIAEHWRDDYSGEWYSQVFLHYVRSRGNCAFAYFDKDQTNKNIVKEDFESKEKEIIIENKSPTLIVPKSKTNLEDFIHIVDNAFPKTLCDKILNEYQNSNEWEQSVVASGLNTNTRNCFEILISQNSILSKNFEIRKNLDQSIYEFVHKIINEYKNIHPNFNIEMDTGYQLLKYNVGQFYTQHTDSFKDQQRSVTCSINLNDDYIGGEFALFDREIMFKGEKGSAIMFPSNFMYPHEIMPVIEGTRYSIVTWTV